jgi:hypothetical protein
MSERFEVGEIAIVFGCHEFSERNGEEREIIGQLDWRVGQRKNGSIDRVFGYLNRASDGKTFVTAPCFLRKRKPPDDQKKRETDKPELGSWDVCPFGTDQKPWRPRRVTA